MNRLESMTKPAMWSTTLLLAAIVAGCGGGGDGVPKSAVGAGPTGGVCVTSPTGCLNLGTTANYVIVAETKIANTPTSAVTGDMAITPNFVASITGFDGPTVDATNDFATSPQVTGRIYAPDLTGGQAGSAGTTPAKMTTLQTDLVGAFNDGFGRTAGTGATNLDLGAGTITTGQDFVPGTYTWVDPGTSGGNVNMTGNITLTGSPTDVWIFQISGTLTLASGTNITLVGARPQNVFWVVSGATTIGTTAHFEGILLDKTAITLGTGATVKGRLQAQSAVTLAGNTVTVP